MNQHNSTSMRLKLLVLMQEQKFSVYTRLSIILHISKLKTEQGDNMVKQLIQMIESGEDEKAIVQIAKVKYNVQMLKSI